VASACCASQDTMKRGESHSFLVSFRYTG
jgi:hypothetical protein